MFSLLQESTAVAVENILGVDVEDAAHAAGHAGQSAGLPQLDLSTFSNQIFWLVVTLVVLYLVLSRVALPRIAAVLSDRQGAISGDLMAAEEFKLKAREAEAMYNKALADARAQAQAIVAQNRAEIQAELDAAIAKADAEISERAALSEARIKDIRNSADVSARELAQDLSGYVVHSFGGQHDEAAILAALEMRMKGNAQ